MSESYQHTDSTIMADLKDFQQATVERVLKLYEGGQRKVLVCDEVGLGKTLIARGVILKLHGINRQQDSFKVVYICSNAVIADQNLRKLGANLDVDIQDAFGGRLSMQHLRIYQKEAEGRLQLIPLTPATSFILAGRQTGTADERALMFALLVRVPALKKWKRALNKILGQNLKSWDEWRKEAAASRILNCDTATKGRYVKEMVAAIETELARKDKTERTLLERIEECCGQVRGINLPKCANSLIGSLRFAFAQISVGLLNPDLVIMDEFQRFRSIMEADEETETGLLKTRFFSGGNSRILMLSATPYKLYSTLKEQEAGDMGDHYSEFLEVLEFLQDKDAAKMARFKKIWEAYTLQLRQFSGENANLLAAKRQAEDELYKYICRTERIGEKWLAECREDRKISVAVTEAEIRTYLECRKLAEEADISDRNLEHYAKASPYLLSFMRNYKFKEGLENFFRKNPQNIQLCDKRHTPNLWLNRETIRTYKKIPPNNGKLAALEQECFKAGEECLLWVPPALPYYKSEMKILRENAGFSKLLIFSAWEMVPRMLASLLSYETERLGLGKLARKTGQPDYFKTRASSKRRTLKKDSPFQLDFRLKGQKADSMQLFNLLYPSRYLIEVWNPLQSLNNEATLKEIRAAIMKKIRDGLDTFPAIQGGNPDERWYYLAPLLLDPAEEVKAWLEFLYKDAPAKLKLKKEAQAIFLKHVKELRSWHQEYGEKGEDLGAAPKDLPEVLTDLALASPAVCVARALIPYAGKAASAIAEKAFLLAKLFLDKRLDTPEGGAAIDLIYKRKSWPWRRAIAYCRDGNLQAMLDEYAYMLASDLGKGNDCLEQLFLEMQDGLDFNMALYRADTYNSFKSNITQAGSKSEKNKPISIRTHFCAAFAQSEGGDEEKDVNRKSSVRKAFNSPFWPFVLATTSIGQEGLDFHAYCRRIMHWNLPGNPVELEQREGRINRFLGHMIRQNVARRYGKVSFDKSVWKEMLAAAERREKTSGCSDLIPWWGLAKLENMARLERLVPLYPCSRETDAYARLLEVLSLYRLSLGQPNQQDFIESLVQNCKNPEMLKKFFINLSPFYRRQERRL